MIVRKALAVGVGQASAAEIDRINILEATRLAIARALGKLAAAPDYLLLDAIRLPGWPVVQRPIIKGDQLSVSIAAASVVAKVVRDRWMARYHDLYPRYNFLVHKGYGTPEHLRLLDRYGPSPVHRLTFEPVRRLAGLLSRPESAPLADVWGHASQLEFPRKDAAAPLPGAARELPC